MADPVDGTPAPAEAGAGRRDAVLASALETFVRYGYRKTSMDDIARAAGISRPGLYFLFAAKQKLFAAAMAAAVERDLNTAASALQDQAQPLLQRLLDAFDAWTGRYLGAVGGELSTFAETHRELLGTAVLDAPHRFHALVIEAVVSARAPQDRTTSDAIARTLISAAIGLKQQTSSRETFRADLSTAIALLLR